ncbi:kelch-like protein 36 [Lineus longissimus]|uniref:kelch-like protein 36 n=1 Tax=Lineus longissimus TaxID=88925 RepID=UPI00315DC7AB
MNNPDDSYSQSMERLAIGRDTSFSEESDHDFHEEDGEYVSSKYQGGFMSSIQELYTSSELCDVTLKAEDCEVKAHKLVLATVGYFHAMFTKPWKEKAHDNVQMEGLTGFGLKALVDFVYKGKMKIRVDYIRDVLDAARHCQFDHLTKVCESYLLEVYKANEETYQEIISVAKEYDLIAKIVEKCEDFFKINVTVGRENYVEIIKAAKACQSEVMLKSVIDYTRCNTLPDDAVTAALERFDEADIKNLLLGRSGLDVTSHAVEFLVRWIEHNEEERLDLLPGLFKSVNLMAFVGETLQYISAMKYIKSSKDCQTLIRQVSEDVERGTYLLSLLPHEYIVLRDINDPKAMPVGQKIPEVEMKGRQEETNFRLTDDIAATVYEDVLYVCGSHWSEAVSKDAPGVSSQSKTSLYCYKVDFLRHQWTQIASLENARCHHSLTGLDGSIYSIGGRKPNGPDYSGFGQTRGVGLCAVDVYSPSNDTWSVGEPFPRKVFNHAAAVLDGKMYVSGGFTGSHLVHHDFSVMPGPSPSPSDSFECFDQATKKWERKANLLQPTNGHQLVASGLALYQLAENLGNEIQRYCPKNDQWTKLVLKPSLPLTYKRISLGAAVPVCACNDCIYIIVGLDDVHIIGHRWWRAHQLLFRYNTKTEEVDMLQRQKLLTNQKFSEASHSRVSACPCCFIVHCSKRTIELFYEQIMLESQSC